MTTRNPPILDGCEVLPPLDPTTAARTAERPPPKQKPNYRKTGKRFELLNAFVDSVAHELTRSEILVWMILYRDTRNGIARTSQTDIARRAGRSTRTVRRIIRRLEQRRLLKTVYQGGLRRGLSKYKVLLP